MRGEGGRMREEGGSVKDEGRGWEGVYEWEK